MRSSKVLNTTPRPNGQPGSNRPTQNRPPSRTRSKFHVATQSRAQKRKGAGHAFVIMPFDRAFDDLHRQAIRPALEQFGLVAERYDDAPRAGTVLEEMRR